MIFYKNGTWHMCQEKIKYIQHGETITQYVGSEGHDWWVDFEQKWEHTDIIEFIPVKPTEEQLSRLEEINSLNIPEGFRELVENYVVNAVFPHGINHPLRDLQIKKENDLSADYMVDLDFRLSSMEIEI